MAVERYSYSGQGNYKLSDHFSVKEFASRSGSKLYSDTVLIDRGLIILLEKLYAKLDCSKIIINSGYRTSIHDKAVGGNGSGQHTLGKAADAVFYDQSGKLIAPALVCCAAEDLDVRGIGCMRTAVHLDTRNTYCWFDERKNPYDYFRSTNQKINGSCYDYFGIRRPVTHDINGDGKVNVSDLIALKQAILQGAISDSDLQLLDVNGDGRVNVSDVIALKKKLLR